MTASQPNDIFQPGDLLNNTYRIEVILGRGGTSEVYKARSEISGKVMAIKALRSEFASNEDFLVLMTREEGIRDVRHDAIVRYFDTQRMPDGVVYLVMDYVDGPGLDRKVAEGGMSAGDLMIVGQRVCEGLIAAHDRNIIHRDLSPDNIILRNDKPSEAVIIDFGIAKDTNPGAETIVGNEFAGKYAYAAPEQLSGKTDPRSDIYSLGAVLLAAFRGKKPNPGRNPMEVVENKRKPLDVEGVPEPLRRVIAKMTHPDPAQRFGSARELLEAFRNPDSLTRAPAAPDAGPLDDATVIAPAMVRAAPPPAAEPLGIPSPKPAPAAAEPAKKGGGALIPVLGVVVVAGLGAGAYFGGIVHGFMGPKYPLAEPFTLVIEKSFGAEPTARGNVPSPEVQELLGTRMTGMGGSADLTLATGDIGEDWGTAMVRIVEAAAPLEEFRIALQDNAVQLTGLAPDRAALVQVQSAFASGFPAPFDGSADLRLGPRFVTAEQLEPILEANADCGRLRLQGAPPVGYGLEDRIIVSGRFATDQGRETLQAAIADVAGDRPVRIEGETLNPSLCEIDAILPRVGPGGFDVRFGWGDREGTNPSGRYKVGENPVIDVLLPKGAKDGYVWVSVVDVKGVVYHLLPNIARNSNYLAVLRGEAGEDGYLRVAYGLAEAGGTGRLAFNVDGSVLGKSKILVLTTDRLLFDELRPTTESVASYAEAIVAARDAGGLKVQSLDSALLTTED